MKPLRWQGLLPSVSLGAIASALAYLVATNAAGRAADDSALVEGFEKRIRPLLVAKCISCHGPDKAKGGLRLDNSKDLLQGGNTGKVIVASKPEQSLLIQAVRHSGDIHMPPGEKLSSGAIADLEQWIQSGAKMPAETQSVRPGLTSDGSHLPPLSPADAKLRTYLQAWYKADSLLLSDGEPVWVWPDESGHGRDLTLTRGVRPDGTGTAPHFAKQSTLRKRPAVHFEVGNGLASGPSHPIPLQGDPAFTIYIVMRLQEHNESPPFDGVLGIGNPALSANPGKPLAAVVQIQRTGPAELQLAGGWLNDASLGTGSFRPHFGKSLILGISKTPGPWSATTTMSINGQRIEGSQLKGTQALAQIQHRTDVGVYLGKALGWCGNIKGDIGEIAVWNRTLSTEEMQGLNTHYAQKFGVLLAGTKEESPAIFSRKDRSHWAFTPLKTSAEHAIDGHIDRRLREHGLTPNPAASKRDYLRRVTFDLTGLPPTPEEVAAFLSDDRPQAYEQVVDRLLTAQGYGERQARWWLDLVRYAETTANDANAVMRYAYRYRDYVIKAFQNDLPYDQFIKEQIAGDLLNGGSAPLDRISATGLLMVGTKALAETDKEQSRLDIIDDQIDVIGRAFLGLTLACARCHDHKFDPIATTDYYALAGILRSTEVFRDEVRSASMWQEWPLEVPGQPAATVMAPKEGVPIDLRVHLRGNRFTLGRQVARRFPLILTAASAPAIDTDQSGRLELANFIASQANPLTARVQVNRVWQGMMGRGLVATSDNFGLRGETPSHRELLDTLASDFVREGWSVKKLIRKIALSAAYRRSSLPNDKALLHDPDNRLLWRHTPRRLQAEEIRDGMLSVSGQLERTPGGSQSGDFLFEKGEVIDKKRDYFRPNQVKADDPFYSQSKKRTIYLPVVRNAVPDCLALFDGPDPNGVTSVRNDTTVPSQALYLMNHPFPRAQATALAQKILAQKDLDTRGKLHRVYQQTLGRNATPSECERALGFLKVAQVDPPATGAALTAQESAWADFTQTLLCCNEFLYLP